MREIPRSAGVTDGICIVIFLGALTLVLPAMAQLHPLLVPFLIAAPTVYYLGKSVILPLRQSSPASLPEDVDLPKIRGLRFRVSDTLDTRVIDLWFRRYVIFSTRHLNGYFRDWRAVLWHELAHLTNRDAMFFHFVGIAGLTLLFCVLWIFAMIAEATINDPARIWVGDDGEIIWDSLIFLLAFPIIALFTLWIRKSLHFREYRADAEAFQTSPEAFSDWLKRAADFEADNPLTWRNSEARFLSLITHPSFCMRKQAINTGFVPAKGIIWRESLRSVGLLFVSSLIAYGNFTIVANAGTTYGFETVITFVNLTFVILSVLAGMAAISTATMEITDQAGLAKSALFVSGFAVAAWLLIFANYGSAVLLGYYEAMTRDLPDVPPEHMSSGVGTFAAIFFSAAATMFVLNLAVWKIVPRWRFSFLLHMVFGALIFLGAFGIPKMLYPLFN